VTIVSASRYEVTTHEMCSSPPRSPTMVGSAVETIVWSSEASSITSSSPLTTRRIERRSVVGVTSSYLPHARAPSSSPAAATIEGAA